jgi:hypothetical protein
VQVTLTQNNNNTAAAQIIQLPPTDVQVLSENMLFVSLVHVGARLTAGFRYNVEVNQTIGSVKSTGTLQGTQGLTVT